MQIGEVLTMAEYIKREAISEEIRKYYYKNPPNFSYGEGFDRGLDRAQRAILDAPSADVAPVRHGEWEIVVGSNGKEYMVCTCCRVSQDLTGVFTYCPNCGCRMDGGDDE